MVLGANWNNETDVGKHVTKLFGGGGQLKIGNFLFSLHHRWTLLLILVGLFVISANNYLNEKAISCLGGEDYHNHYCYLHGAAHIPDFLQAALAPKESGRRCTAEGHGDKDRSTSYYIWLPFILTLCAVVTKLPWIVWKNVIERGLMEKLVKEINSKLKDQALNLKSFSDTVEEEDMTEELSKKTGDEISRRPYANNFVIDDPFAMDGILEQVQAQFDYEAEQEEKKKQIGRAHV